MSDVKPDTSLYSALEMKLHALAKALKGKPGELLEEMDQFGGAWVLANGSATDFMVRLAKGCEYRIKPKPRELWAIRLPSGELWGEKDGEPKMYLSEPMCAEGNKTVRFVESPPAA